MRVDKEKDAPPREKEKIGGERVPKTNLAHFPRKIQQHKSQGSIEVIVQEFDKGHITTSNWHTWAQFSRKRMSINYSLSVSYNNVMGTREIKKIEKEQNSLSSIL